MSSSIQNALDAFAARALARVDDLTGLANSRYFHTRLEEEIARADPREPISRWRSSTSTASRRSTIASPPRGSWTLQKVAAAARGARRPRRRSRRYAATSSS